MVILPLQSVPSLYIYIYVLVCLFIELESVWLLICTAGQLHWVVTN